MDIRLPALQRVPDEPTRQSMELDVTTDREGTLLTCSMTIEVAGSVSGRIAEWMVRGIVRRHLRAGVHQRWHHLEFEVR